MAEDPRFFLPARMASDKFQLGLATLESLHASVHTLLYGVATRALEHDDYGYAGFYMHIRTPALYAIASDGWVQRHLHDFALLAQSPVLGPCCRSTVLDLFGVAAFHVAIQHYPVADGLVQGLCHQPGDRVERIRRIAGQLVYLRSTCGSYPPSDLPYDAVSSDAPAFDAIPVR